MSYGRSQSDPMALEVPDALLQEDLEENLEDNWRGITDPKTRRRLQNRVHQRLWRRRHGIKPAKSKKGTPSFQKEFDSNQGTYFADTQLITPAPLSLIEPEPLHTLQNIDYWSHDSKEIIKKSLSNRDPVTAQQMIKKLEESYQDFMLGSPRVDHLLTLIQFNVFRALLSNNAALGFGDEWVSHDAISPFHTQNGLTPKYISCPPSLRSTPLQRSVAHHPWIDLFPIPAMRDNILRLGEDFDDEELCVMLVELCNRPGERNGLIVWGEPSDPYAWEISEGFLKDSGWVLKGCHELFKSTNYWRSMRGEESLCFEIENEDELSS